MMRKKKNKNIMLTKLYKNVIIITIERGAIFISSKLENGLLLIYKRKNCRNLKRISGSF